MSQSQRSTYYTCNGCDHATFKLPEAVAHFAEYGTQHSFDYNGDFILRGREWEPHVCQELTTNRVGLKFRHHNHLRGGCRG